MLVPACISYLIQKGNPGVRLADLVIGLEAIKIHGRLNRDIKGISYNSKHTEKDYIFVAIEGLKHDGHQYIDDALSRGASTLVVSKDPDILPDGATVIRVADTRLALSRLSASYYGSPSKSFDLIGVTGTNGKTTTAYLVKSILESSHIRTGLIGSLGLYIDDHFESTSHTTPESLELQQMFRRMADVGVKACVMEVSSHSIELERINDCDFDTGIFTNLTHEHLDFHKTMEHYYEVKRKLFFSTKRTNIVNIDDQFGRRLANELLEAKRPIISYGIYNKADVHARDILIKDGGSSFTLVSPAGTIEITSALPGKYNVYNSLAAAACCLELGIGLETVRQGLEAVKGIPGRFERINIRDNINVIIDYAHTPDGFVQLLETVKSFARGRIIIVFGCVGERDRSKRSVMGRIAAEYCDLSILTTDNCRLEDPGDIIEEIKQGIPHTANNIEILDRAEAIRYAILNSRENDTILITGKGHEHRQIINEEAFYFNETEIVEQARDELLKMVGMTV